MTQRFELSKTAIFNSPPTDWDMYNGLRIIDIDIDYGTSATCHYFSDNLFLRTNFIGNVNRITGEVHSSFNFSDQQFSTIFSQQEYFEKLLDFVKQIGHLLCFFQYSIDFYAGSCKYKDLARDGILRWVLEDVLSLPIVEKIDIENFLIVISEGNPFITSFAQEEIKGAIAQFSMNEIIKNASDANGYVYLIQADLPDKPCKIGKSTSVPDRMKLFGVKLPFDFQLLHIIPCLDHSKVEKKLHERFRDKRVNGEWFNLDQQDILDIKSIESIVDDEVYIY